LNQDEIDGINFIVLMNLIVLTPEARNVACVLATTQLRNLNQLREMQQRSTQKIKTITREKANTTFNEVRQFAYVLGEREREILLIQQPI